MDGLKIEYIPVGKIKPYEKNARKHKDFDVDAIVRSIEEFGFDDPIGIWSDKNIIVEGHGRLLAAKKLGMKEVPCIRLDHLTDEQRRAYALAHNKTAENSEWDLELLPLELEEIVDIDMTQFGFEVPEEEPEIEEDEVPDVPDEPQAKLGDIYQLGRHRLMCGDSTSEADVRRLMNGQSAKMLFTSPPYSDMREYNGGKDLTVDNLVNFIPTYRPYTDYQCVNLGIQTKDFEIFPYWDAYTDIAHECGYKLLAWNVWDKTMCGSIGQQKAFFPIRHEFVFVYGTAPFKTNQTWDKQPGSIRKNHKRRVRQADGSFATTNTGDATNTKKRMESVLSLCSETGEIRKLHPATFPVGFPSEYIRSMTDENDNVIEPFGGSGTTLIACEQTNRNCYMMELDPHYVDVIIARWENLTGEKAVLLDE